MFRNPRLTAGRGARVALRSGAVVAATAAAVGGMSAAPAAAHEGLPPQTHDLPAPAMPQNGPAESVIHVVARGESLSEIARAYGYSGQDDWRHVYDANPTKLDDPNLIYAGLHLRIPTANENFVRRDVPVPAPVVVEPAPARRGGAAASRSASRAPAAGGASVAGADVWDQLAACESGGNWSTNTGNGYAGGLQFHPGTWAGHGGTQYAPSAAQASREQQIEIAKRVQASQGWGAWPACSRKLGLR